MKKLLPIFSIAIIMAACNTTPQEGQKANPSGTMELAASAFNPDTAGLSQFQAWKAQNELAEPKDYSRQVQQKEDAPVAKAKKISRKPVSRKPQYTAASKRNVVYRQSKQASDSPSSNGNSGPVVMDSESSNTAEAPEKRGWSKAAKGTAIGAGGGAVIGATVYKKNRALGAAIGGVLGGGIGYKIGRNMDKKEGRR